MKLPRMQAYCINYFPFCWLIDAASVAIVTHVCRKGAKHARWKKMCCRCLAQWAGNTVLLVFLLLTRTTDLCHVCTVRSVLIYPTSARHRTMWFTYIVVFKLHDNLWSEDFESHFTDETWRLRGIIWDHTANMQPSQGCDFNIFVFSSKSQG